MNWALRREYMAAVVVATLALATVASCSLLPQVARASSAGKVAGEVEDLAGSPEAKAVEREIFGELADPSLARSSKRFLAQYGGRLTLSQRSLLQLSQRIASPKYRALRSDLERRHIGASQIAPLFDLLAVVDASPAIRGLIRRGEWLQNHPGALSAYFVELRVLAARAPANPIVAALARILAGKGAAAYIRRLAPLTVASLLPPLLQSALARSAGGQHEARLAGLPGSRVSTRRRLLLSPSSSGAQPQSSLGSRASQQLAELSDRATTQLSLVMADIQAAAARQEAQMRSYLDAHRGEINTKLVAEMVEQLFGGWEGKVAGWLLPYVKKWLDDEAYKIQHMLPAPEMETPTGPQQCAPHSPSRLKSTAADAGGSQCGVALGLGPDALANGIPGVHYTQPLQATGGGQLAWRAEGEMPAGLYLNYSTGVIEGTPRYLGVSDFTVVVQDSLGDSGRQTYSLTVTEPSCSGSPCAVAYGSSEVTVVWGACGCAIPSGYHGLFGYYLEPVVNGVAGGAAGQPFVLGPLYVNAPDGSEGVPVFAGSGGRLWYSYPHFDGSGAFGQSFPDQMYFMVYFGTHKEQNEELTLFPIGTSNTVTVK
jgi:hypothetical protein